MITKIIRKLTGKSETWIGNKEVKYIFAAMIVLILFLTVTDT